MDKLHKEYIQMMFSAARIETDPFPHIVIRDIFPPDVYSAMLNDLPSKSSLRVTIFKNRVHQIVAHLLRHMIRMEASETVFFYIDSTAKAGFGFDEHGKKWKEDFGDCILLIKTLAHQAFGFTAWSQGQDVFFFRPAGWSILPHNHGAAELLNMLVYFPTEENFVEQGTVLYKLRREHDGEHINTQVFENGSVEPAKIVPFLPNTLVAWINAKDTVHGSIEIAGGDTRRYLYGNSTKPR